MSSARCRCPQSSLKLRHLRLREVKLICRGTSVTQAKGLLPKWVQWALTQQPALFDRAFRRLFAQACFFLLRPLRMGGTLPISSTNLIF